jgi:hypothetical protein
MVNLEAHLTRCRPVNGEKAKQPTIEQMIKKKKRNLPDTSYEEDVHGEMKEVPTSEATHSKRMNSGDVVLESTDRGSDSISDSMDIDAVVGPSGNRSGAKKTKPPLASRSKIFLFILQNLFYHLGSILHFWLI